jgi:hypothetical protein
VGLEGLGSTKIKMTLSEMQPAKFTLVTQCLNPVNYSVTFPKSQEYPELIKYRRELVSTLLHATLQHSPNVRINTGCK